ncbi:MAG: M14 family zinc carboxypeptidase [Anaerolineae bacterium]
MINRIFILIILTFAAACQPTSVLPAQVELPFASPVRLSTFVPTQTPRAVIVVIPTQPPTPLPSLTSSPATIPTFPLQPTLAPPPLTLSPAANLASISDGTPTTTPVQTLTPAVNTFQIGQSVEGRSILAWRFGTGDKRLLLVGGVHTGFEANTVLLLNELVDHFEGTPADVLPGITLILLPVLNPDGLLHGRSLDGRFNANGVDLNRNWGCEWSEEAFFQNRRVDPGVRAFSEPETQALVAYIRNEPPTAALFFHSAANGVFAGGCEGDHGSQALSAVMGEASGYGYGEDFSAYKVSGTESSWLDGQGIPAADVELSGTRSSEFVRNLKGIIAVQCWLLDNPALPQCNG